MRPAGERGGRKGRTRGPGAGRGPGTRGGGRGGGGPRRGGGTRPQFLGRARRPHGRRSAAPWPYTAWSLFGTTQAILAGDALLAVAVDTLAHRFPPGGPQAVRELSGALLALVAGQGADLIFETRADVGLDECLETAAGKTPSLLAAACALGALAARAEAERVDALRQFGRRLGLAFQLVDDLLGIWGDTAVTGKPVGSDLRSRKKSLPVVAALAGGTPAGDRLAALYHRTEPLGDDEIPVRPPG